MTEDKIDSRYTNSMIDDIMSHLVSSFCYRGTDIDIRTQRMGFIELEHDTYHFYYMFDSCLLFMIEDDDFDYQEGSECREETMRKFSNAILYSMKKYGLCIMSVECDDRTPSFMLSY